MRTEAEIKKGLEICNVGICGAECPYYGDGLNLCRENMGRDVRTLIDQIRNENRALRTELAVNGKDDVPVENVGNIPDQTAKQDYGKLDPTLVPVKVIWAIAAVRRFGLTKYHDPFNYRQVEKERLRAAAYRHFLKYVEDPERIDPESGLPHLWHLATNVAFLCELEGGTHD